MADADDRSDDVLQNLSTGKFTKQQHAARYIEQR
jgi:hypothetical protein